MYLEAFEIAEKEAAKGRPALICKDGDRFYVNITDQLSLTSIGHGFIRLHPDGKIDPLTDEAKGFARDVEPVRNHVQAEDLIAAGCSSTSASQRSLDQASSPIPIKQHVTSYDVVLMN